MTSPMYERIFAALRDQILNGHFAVGDRVPSEKELADEYKVSRITSKKALEMLSVDKLIVRKPGRGSFVADPGERTGAPADDSGSVPRRGAKSGNKPLIGLLITDFSESYGTGLVHGMEEASRKHDSYLIVRRTFGNPSYEEETIKGLLEMEVDGLIIMPAQGEFFNAEILKLVIGKFPFVLVDRHLKGISAGSICTDNAAGAKQGIEYLFELGHRHIGLLTPPPVDTTAVEERIEGFVQAHAEKGIAVDRELWLDDILSTLPSAFTDENRVKDILKIKEHLRKNPHITALFAMEYNIALLARDAARQLGLSVPGDLSIICFDCPAVNGQFSFTHLQQQQEEIGRIAFEHILMLREEQRTPNRTTLEAILIEGESTAIARSTKLAKI
ncbi:GntR family transcriptional regulator [Paenibacillus harenae]|uniref:GntR family transcriptional regulator n=1 Tax=Paenibacillus harenae TaxID=306543 RepID=UPI0027944825|nr:GntR family transcriptional regulator [Paenibacillus harenae]MDQ0063686.1 DNA-binding LacI/PurR family transcriptional regulator [Paenibacillus harenae]